MYFIRYLNIGYTINTRTINEILICGKVLIVHVKSQKQPLLTLNRENV